LGDGFALVQDMADVLKKTNTEFLGDRIKSPSEAVKTLLAGAHQKILPFDVSCRAFKLHIRGGRDAHPTRVLLFFDIQFKCRTAYCRQ
jgi:hypothetical protein